MNLGSLWPTGGLQDKARQPRVARRGDPGDQIGQRGARRDQQGAPLPSGAVRGFVAAPCEASHAAARRSVHRDTRLGRLACADRLLPRPPAENVVEVAAAREVLRRRAHAGRPRGPLASGAGIGDPGGAGGFDDGSDDGSTR